MDPVTVCRWVHHVFTMVDGVRTEDELSSVSTSAVVLHQQCAPMTSDQCGQKPPLLRLPKHTSPAPPLPHLVLLLLTLLFPILLLLFPILSKSSSSSFQNIGPSSKTTNFPPKTPVYKSSLQSLLLPTSSFLSDSCRSFSCQCRTILWLFWISRYRQLRFLPHFLLSWSWSEKSCYFAISAFSVGRDTFSSLFASFEKAQI